MASTISTLLSALQDWQQAVEALRRRDGTRLEAREDQVKQATEQVLKCLEPAIADIDQLIQRARGPESPSATALRQTLAQRPKSVLSAELQTIQPLAVSHKHLETLVDYVLRSPDAIPPISDAQQLQTLFKQLSQTLVQEYRATQQLSRKPKKRRRRDLMLGTLHTTIGIGLLVGNTQMHQPAADYSYILGGNALLMALRNFIGQLADLPQLDQGG